VFVDNSGRRSKLLRRIGLLVGVLCLGYAVVLGLAFLGIGTSSPSSLLPFGSAQGGQGGQGGPAGQSGTGPGAREQGGVGDVVQPSGSPPALPSGFPTPSASANAD